MEKQWQLKRANELHEIIARNFQDKRGLRRLKPKACCDANLEKDTAMSLISGIRQKEIMFVKYWGIILPEEVEIINMNKMRTYCPNCVNGVYTNVWTYDNELSRKEEPWQNLFILSPNYEYPFPFRSMIDCDK